MKFIIQAKRFISANPIPLLLASVGVVVTVYAMYFTVKVQANNYHDYIRLCRIQGGEPINMIGAARDYQCLIKKDK